MRQSGGELARARPGVRLENHGHAVALHYMHYNFCRVHKTLRITPAIEAGIADHVWTLEELVALLERNLPNK